MAILNFGARLSETLKASENLKKGVNITIVDEGLLNLLMKILLANSDYSWSDHDNWGRINRGFGSHAVDFLTKKGLMDSSLKFRSMTLPDIFIDQDTPNNMYKLPI